jgi:hypothetical protein
VAEGILETDGNELPMLLAKGNYPDVTGVHGPKYRVAVTELDVLIGYRMIEQDAFRYNTNFVGIARAIFDYYLDHINATSTVEGDTVGVDGR